PVIASGTATDVDPSTLTNTDSILGSLAPGQFYVSLTSGDDEGARATITGNTATELTLDADLSALDVVGEAYEIRKHLSITSLFGAANETGLHADINSSLADNVLLTRDAVETFFYSNVLTMEGWKDSMANDAADETIEPLVPLAVRRRVVGDLTIYPAGAVRLTGSAVTLTENADTMIALPYSVDVAVGDLGLDDLVERGPNPVVADNLLVINADGSVTWCFYSDIAGFSGWLDYAYLPAPTIPAGSVIVFQRKGTGSLDWVIPAAPTP
ncbi:MAG: hypothetical protein ACR2RV_05920, partial [Verrucomicrobiales bacterium]